METTTVECPECSDDVRLLYPLKEPRTVEEPYGSGHYITFDRVCRACIDRLE